MTLRHVFAHWLLTAAVAPVENAVLTFDTDTGAIVSIEGNQPIPDDLEGVFILTPGLINTHCHLELYAEAPIPFKDSMVTWLATVTQTYKDRTDDEKRTACHKSLLEMVRTGTTCVNDITSTGVSLEVLSQIGLRGIVSPEFFAPVVKENYDVRAYAQQITALTERYSQESLLTVGVSPHAPYNVTPLAAKTVLESCRPSFVHSHMAETAEEVTWFQTGISPWQRANPIVTQKNVFLVSQGVTPVEYYAGLYGPNWLIAHGVFLSPSDKTLLANHGVSIAHCPRSNVWLSGKTIPNLPILQNEGIAVGLGTDSRVSCPDLDLRAEARFAKQHHGASAQTVFELATTGSAAALKRCQDLGQLKPGYLADLVLWRCDSIEKDAYETWLDESTQAISVWVNGRIVLDCEI